MKIVTKLKNLVNHLSLKAFIALQVYAKAEPVRSRSALVSVILAAGVLVPALADEHLAESIAGVVAVALPLLAGESARKRVQPVK
ncbi:hypothetical protein OG709_29915 [Streptomyces sp. NBC_01267]|uniref:hypothetical protein n=1 Tax=Streptomyces sp. NBC_01267 TaxID=2903805 RepID=UPI002E2FD970|nr:hypothetical protein [Streptomyces sp. NBC_01267]